MHCIPYRLGFTKQRAELKRRASSGSFSATVLSINFTLSYINLLRSPPLFLSIFSTIGRDIEEKQPKFSL